MDTITINHRAALHVTVEYNVTIERGYSVSVGSK